VIEARGLSYDYPNGEGGVREISLEVEPGQVVCIIGPNGAGKSTLLKLMAGILTPASGEVRIEGRSLADWGPRELARRIGYLPQESDTSFPMTALDVVLSGRASYLSRFRWEGADELKRSREALALCDAAGLEARPVDEMSGGERKRVFLARVFVAEPRVLLLDEPFAALDAAHIGQIGSIVREQSRSRGTATLLVAHDFNWAAAVSDRMVALSAGRLVAEGPPAAVLRPEVLKRCFGVEGELIESAAGRRWFVPRFDR
jgi:ABC-type cobalamin/Fe3+-siderophores transport system ATPase subunit